MKYLGIDYGSKNVGIAISDDRGAIAFPHATFENDTELLAKLLKLSADEHIERIIVGDTRAFGGHGNAVTNEAEAFIRALSKATQTSVTSAPEVDSSKAVSEPGGHTHNNAAAAAFILQRYIDMHVSDRKTATSDGVSYDDFAKLDIRIGTVKAVERVPDTDKLLKCTIDFGEFGQRTIVSGIAQWKSPEELVGRQLPYIVNLAPRVLRGVESQGMLLAASDEQGVALILPEREVPSGTKLK